MRNEISFLFPNLIIIWQDYRGSFQKMKDGLNINVDYLWHGILQIIKEMLFVC